MVDVNVSDHRNLSLFDNRVELVKVIYDFDKDAGASADDYMLFTADKDLVIMDAWINCITELDSAADGASIDVGIDGGDEDALFDGVAEADTTAGNLIQPTVVEGTPNVMPCPLKLAEDGKIRMKILGEDLTAGKLEFNFLVTRF